jgi:carboxyl-terminal processing protease
MIRASRALVVGALVSTLVAGIAFVGGMAVALRWGNNLPLVAMIGPASAAEGRTPANVADQFGVFWEVWGLIDGQFYREEPLDYQQMTYGAIRGMLQSLGDDYTVFEEPQAAQESAQRLSGQFEGIGAYIEYKDNKLLIVSPIEESPAEQAGILAGDQVMKVDGQELATLLDGLGQQEGQQKAISLIRGPAGTTVNLTIFRANTNETLQFSIVRAALPDISVISKMLDEDIGYLQLTQFKATTADELDQALGELLEQQPSGLILDLRNNPGGYLDQAQKTLGRFLPDGVALRERLNNGETETLDVIRSNNAPSAFDVPLVVLTNGGSASASEIVAGALRDRDRATLVGEKTFGKGSVQTIRNLSDGSSARITIARWLTPEGGEIHQQGIEPDVYVPFVSDEQYNVKLPQQRAIDLSEVNDSQLWWAIRLLTSDERPDFPPPTPTTDPAQIPLSDATVVPEATTTP